MQVLSSILFTLSLWFQIDVGTVRANFEKSADSKEDTETLYQSLKSYSKSDPVLLAYKGAAYGLKARYVEDRKTKKDLFISGAKDIEAAVAAASENVEIRFIRLVIQENTPNVLKYKANIHEDKQMILANFAKQTKAVQETVRRYAVKRSKVFTASELSKL
ncbi:hypothetical protein ACL9RF_08345 [Sphingobacterium sp. Mn56C]|uniref:hypothetical protein n=1 Tax=Sphingobacterium sp. Mn56C TaxID=3395261 RepID=UPI003BE1A0B8